MIPEFSLRRLRISAALLLCSAGSLIAVSLAAQSGSDNARQNGPPPEMVKACIGKSSGDACSGIGRQGRQVNGKCFAPPQRALACRPERGLQDPQNNRPPEAQSPPMISELGEPIPYTQADTSSVLCGMNRSKLNATLGLESAANWLCSGGNRVLTGNGIPDHSTGNFPNAHNPHRIEAQSVRFVVPLSPVARTGEGNPVRTSGYALNGVKFEPGTAGRCATTATNPSDCRLGRGDGDWIIEALGQTSFNFGDDMNHAHVQPSGEYHYHGIPTGMLSAQAKAGKEMQLIGWASDGFPIYARFGHSDTQNSNSPLKVMQPSYRLKQKPNVGRPPIGLIPMGAFTQDYEYVSGLGDLDQCNGRFAATPEFPAGVYHYYATDTYPYVQRCVKGRPSSSDSRRPQRRQ